MKEGPKEIRGDFIKVGRTEKSVEHTQIWGKIHNAKLELICSKRMGAARKFQAYSSNCYMKSTPESGEYSYNTCEFIFI
jgi:hypothetical protein